MKKIETWTELREYLDGLGNEGKPFDCPNLRVLTENLEIGSVKYKKGDLICPCYAGTGHTLRCKLAETGLMRNEKGNYEVLCAWDHSKFEFEIVSFEPGK